MPAAARGAPLGVGGVADLVSAAVDGQPRALARLLSLVEDASPDLPAVMALLAPRSADAWVVGVTGAPGVGKSTTTSALVGHWRAVGLRVGVLAVDPSSPFSGGALLGDRVRMQDHATDPGVFIRSMASRGHLGGLAATTPQAVRVLDAAGFEVVVVETVGVGQSEVEVAALADTTLVLLAPGMGDGVQAAKAGILEVGDVFAVNKADRDGAAATVRELRHVLRLAPAGDWQPPVVPTVAATGQGLDELAGALQAHRAAMDASGGRVRRRRARAAEEVTALVVAGLRTALVTGPGRALLESLADRVAAGQLDPYAAAAQLAAAVGEAGVPR